MHLKNSIALSEESCQELLKQGAPKVIRIKIPSTGTVTFQDSVRGVVRFECSELDDKVMLKNDGMPTYHLASIVDDHLMEITHVIRGEEWLPSAPLHVLLYDSFGWERPKFAHLPLILRPDGKGKLSKRDGDKLGFPVFPIDWITADGEKYNGYKEDGYFKDAFMNMLALLGWNPGDNQEIFSLDELVNLFSLERVGKSGAGFDPDKTKWFNQQYLRATSNQGLAEMIIADGIVTGDYSTDYLANVCGLMKERATFIKDIVSDGSYFFSTEITEYDEKTVRKKWKEETPEIMQELISELNTISDFTTENIETVFSAYLAKKEYGFGKVGPGFRLLITGKGMGPSMFEICATLGKSLVLSRMEEGLAKVNALKAAAQQ